MNVNNITANNFHTTDYSQRKEDKYIVPIENRWTVEDHDAIYKEDIYNNYNNWDIVIHRSHSPLANSLADRIMHDGSDIFFDYYSGKISRSDLTNFMRKSCDLLIEYHTYCTQDKNLTDSTKEEIIGTIYDMFGEINSRTAAYYCEQEGKSYNTKYNTELYAYYDSEIYYDWKEVSDLLLDSATDICNDILGYTADIESYKGNTYANNNFNLEWSFNNQSTKRIASFVDTTVEPPHNFRFFYKQCAYPGTTDAAKQNAGYLSIWSDNDVIELDVPYKILANADVDFKSGETLLSKYISKLTNNPIINAFFKNMQIYHTNYGVTYYNMLQANLVRQNPHLYQG